MLCVSRTIVLFAALITVINAANSCERITVPMCQDVGYNMTRMPNFVGNSDQNTAAKDLITFETLLQSGCSKHLKFFLCSLYVPMCSERVPDSIPSCQSVCFDVKQSCMPALIKYNLRWPDALNCSKLPELDNGLCMGEPADTTSAPSENAAKPAIDFIFPIKSSNDTSGSSFDYSSGYDTVCPTFLVEVPTAGEVHCAGRCGVDWNFTQSAKNAAQIWMGIWAAVCFVATLFTVATFWLNTSRFQYPARPIIYISLCCFVSSVAFLFRVFVGAEAISCDVQVEGSVPPHVVVEGLKNSGCVLVFLLTYYFGLAATCWWLVLCACWYLSTAQRKTHTTIDTLSSFFHFIGWVLPAVLTTIVIALRQMDGDELTGMCSIGNRDRNALLIFHIIPLASLIVFGLWLLFTGFLAFSKLQREYQEEGRDTTKLDRLMNRVGLFAGIAVIPFLTLLACFVYEYVERPRWTQEAITRAIECSEYRHGYQCGVETNIPTREVLLLEKVIILILGVTTGIWVWGDKTSTTWSRFLSSLCCGRKLPSKTPLVITEHLLNLPCSHSPVLLAPFANGRTPQLSELKDSTPYHFRIVSPTWSKPTPLQLLAGGEGTYIACV